jgi:hypothetical protein
MKCTGITAVAASAVVAVLGFGAAPADAQQPRQQGLVNVEIGDITILERVGVGVAANVAANVCIGAVQVGVIAEQVARTGEFVCETAEQEILQIIRN